MRFVNTTVIADREDAGLCVTVDGERGTINLGAEDGSAAGSGAATVDCEGHYLVPGLIDIQFNGGLGVDFSDATLTAADVDRVLEALPRFGVTSVVLTLISSSPETYARNMPLMRDAYLSQPPWPAAPTSSSGSVKARVLGLHLEGPFLHPTRKGAHAVGHLAAPLDAPVFADESAGKAAMAAASIHNGNLKSAHPSVTDQQIACLHILQPLMARYSLTPHDLLTGLVRIITLAPELRGAMDAIAALTSLGVTVAIGHTTATYDVAVQAVRAGASLVTHLYNAMPPLHHRSPGVIGLLGLPSSSAASASSSCRSGAEGDKDRAAVTHPVPFSLPPSSSSSSLATADDGPCCPYFSLISDCGVHLHPSALALAYRAQPRKAVLVTDGMRALGLPPGDYTYGDLDVTIYPGRASVQTAQQRQQQQEQGSDSSISSSSSSSSRGAESDPIAAAGGHYDGLHAVLKGSDVLAGAVLPLDACLRSFIQATRAPLSSAVQTAASQPADLLRLAPLGRLAHGAPADLLLLDRHTLQVRRVWVGGKEVPL